VVGDAEPGGHAGLVRRVRLVRRGRLHGQLEDVLLLAAEHRQDAVRWQLGERLGEVEVVGELGAVGLPALAHLADQAPSVPHALAQLADQVGVLGEPFDQDGPGTVQGGLFVCDGVGDVRRRGRARIQRVVSEQRVGQRFQARLAGDLRAGAALRLVRQVDVLQPGLRVGRQDLRLQGGVQFALRPDRLQHRYPPVLQLAQVAQAFLERAQLLVVQCAGGLLAVPGDERHGGAAVQQVHRGGHLTVADPELLSDALVDRRGGHGSDCD
jgi:hypothetical protein